MKIWIINHYAIPPSMGGLVRHYYFSKYLQEKGHEVKIFTSSKIHNTDINMIKDKSLYKCQNVDDINYTFVRSSDYKGNGIKRIVNMLEFPVRMRKVCKQFGKPDIIYTSSPDLFTAISAVKLAKKLGVKKVVEIRDLWPESIVEYNNISRKNPVIKILYYLERRLYHQADKLIFTMEGGKKYINEKNWCSKIDINKIQHINNGVDLQEFIYNKENYTIKDQDLEDKDSLKVVYTGSIRKVNQLGIILDCARLLKEKGESNIKFLIWGDGNEKDELIQICKSEGLTNIVFKGKVEKKFIPFILSSADVNLIHGKGTPIMRFGCSPNKLFEYLASKKPIISDLKTDFDLLESYQCGIVKGTNNPVEIIEMIERVKNMTEIEIETMTDNAFKCAKEYDYKRLTGKLENVLEDMLE